MIKLRSQLKPKFERGDKPLQADFWDWLDSCFLKGDDEVVLGTGTMNRLMRWTATNGAQNSLIEVDNSGNMTLLSGGDLNLEGGEIQINGDSLAGIHILYDNTSSGLSADNLQEAVDELDQRIDDVELVSFRYLNWSAGRNSTATTNIYLRRDDGIPTNVSPFTVPFDATIYAVSARTSASQSWTAEIRRDNGSGFTVIASLVISSSFGNYTNALSVDVDAGDLIALYCNGTSIDDPTIDVYLKSR